MTTTFLSATGSVAVLLGYMGPGPGLTMLGALIGLLLTLTRSIPFVLTQADTPNGFSPLSQAIKNRASGFIYKQDANAVAVDLAHIEQTSCFRCADD